MPKGKSEPTELGRAADDAAECLRAYRKRPNEANRTAVDAALDTYQREWLRDFGVAANPDAPPRLKAVS